MHKQSHGCTAEGTREQMAVPTTAIRTTTSHNQAGTAVRSAGRNHGLAAAPSTRLPRPPLRLYLGSDLSAISLALAAAFALGLREAVFMAAAPLAVILGLRVENLYRRPHSGGALDEFSQIVIGAAAGTLVTAAIAGVGAATAVAFAACVSVAIATGRGLLYRYERLRAVRHPARIVIVGTGAAAQEFADRLLRHPEYGMEPLGFVDTQPGLLDPDLELSMLGDVCDLLPIVETLGVERVVVDPAAVPEEDLVGVLDQAARNGVEVSVLPALARHLSTAIAVEGLAGMTLLSYRTAPHRGVSWAAKRVLDVAVSLLALTVTLPLTLAVAVAVKAGSPGPVLFVQHRVGRDGRLFKLYKFRSMTLGAEQCRVDLQGSNEAEGPYFKMAEDPRITRIGRVIRRFSIDEIPQFWNVLKGDMSVVGPRPVLDEELHGAPGWFLRRLTVPPGLTGLWQVSGRFLVPWHEATRLDVFYADHWSFGLDVKILLRTIPVVLTGRGAR